MKTGTSLLLATVERPIMMAKHTQVSIARRKLRLPAQMHRRMPVLSFTPTVISFARTGEHAKMKPIWAASVLKIGSKSTS